MRFAPAPVVIVALAALVAAGGCKASLKADVNASASTGRSSEEIADFDKPLEPAEAQRAATPDQPSDAALLGARQDLTFKGPATAACKCLAVAVGQPSDPAFQWAGTPAKTSSGSQLVIALSSAGMACPEAGERASGASYWGYEMLGNDVLVVVENAAAGRPVAGGAIIPRPLGSGQVYVRPADKKVVYGRPASGSGDRCQIGTLTPIVTKPDAAATPSSGVRIKTDEADPTDTRTEIP